MKNEDSLGQNLKEKTRKQMRQNDLKRLQEQTIRLSQNEMLNQG
jgi:hypothetical protein